MVEGRQDTAGRRIREGAEVGRPSSFIRAPPRGTTQTPSLSFPLLRSLARSPTGWGSGGGTRYWTLAWKPGAGEEGTEQTGASCRAVREMTDTGEQTEERAGW